MTVSQCEAVPFLSGDALSIGRVDLRENPTASLRNALMLHINTEILGR